MHWSQQNQQLCVWQTWQPPGQFKGTSHVTRYLQPCQHAQGHAGTVPMALRADPLAGAAEAVAAIERRCGGGRYEDTRLAAGMCLAAVQEASVQRPAHARRT